MASAVVVPLSCLILSKSTFLAHRPRPNLRALTQISCSFSFSSSTELNTSFAPPKPEPKPKDSEPDSTSFVSESGDQLFVPWIFRGEDGNLKLQAQPPAHLLKAVAAVDTKEKKKKKNNNNKKKETDANSAASESRFSKAARRYYNEKFSDPLQRLSKVLAAAGVASRRSCEELIFDGRVTVNGSTCRTPQTRVHPERDMIYVNGSRLPKKLPPKVYLALNKPKGYICSSGEKESKSVMSLFEDYLKSWNKKHPGLPKPRLFTVGRLDVNTTGLIIVTNNGHFAQRLSHPSSKLSKEYIATVDGVVSKRHLIAISEGTIVDGIHCAPDSVELLPKQPDIPRPRLRIVVHEGRKHEVRELVKNAGLEIHALRRVRIGGFKLPTDLGYLFCKIHQP